MSRKANWFAGGAHPRRKGLVLAGAALSAALLAAPAAQAQSWKLWADKSNGVVPGVFPAIAVSRATHTLYYAYRLSVPDAKGRVYRVDMLDPARRFTMMPQTGFDLPTSSPQFNVHTLTTGAAGEPIVGMYSALSYNLENKILRWDAASSSWVEPKLFTTDPNVAAGALQPNKAMYILVHAPDGAIWGGHEFSNVSVSTDGGLSFAVYSETAALKKVLPNFDYAGAKFGMAVAADGTAYAGTEVGGVIRSADHGQTWTSLDAFWGDAKSPMVAARWVTNCAGVGVTHDGKVVFQGGFAKGATLPDEGVHFYYADPVAQVVKSALGIMPGRLGGLSVERIVTADSGDMFFIDDNLPSTDPMYGEQGGVYTSKDGLHWQTFNTGIQWVVGQAPNLAAANTSLTVDGNDVYLATIDGKIWHYNTVGAPDPPTVTAGGGGGAGDGGGDSASSSDGKGCSMGGGSSGGAGGGLLFAALAIASRLGQRTRRGRRPPR